MKSLFDPEVFQHTVSRVEGLQSSAPRQWGKMTPAQMLEHSARVVEMACGKGPNEPEFAAAKTRLLSLMREFRAMGEKCCDGQVHAFFGRLSGAEWGVTQYKHLDHHLRQFGA